MPLCTLHSPLCISSVRPVGLWRTFDSLSTGTALMVLWRSLLGRDFAYLQSFLQPTPEQSLTYPCTRNPWCECDHEISEDPEWEQVAVCTCGECEPIPLTRQDTTLHAFNPRAFGEAVRKALGLAPPLTSIHSSLSILHSAFLPVGSYPPLHAPIYFLAPTSTATLAAAVNAMLANQTGPFLLLTPTPTWMTAPVLRSLNTAGCAHADLSTLLPPDQLRPFSPSACSEYSAVPIRPISPMLPILEAWSKAVTSRPAPAILEGVRRELTALRKDFLELRTAKQRLEQMHAAGIFGFTRKVDPTSFKTLCAILSEGDVAKASRVLGLGDSTVRNRLLEWRTRGPAYHAMLDLVRWRKKVGRKETIPLNDAILHDKADTTDYPALLSDVLDGLLSMSDANWQDLAEELSELLRPVLSKASHTNLAHPTPVRKTI